MNVLKNLPVVSFLIRYWMLILFTLLAVMALQNEALFQQFGALLYLPALGSAMWLTAMFLRHLFFWNTLDRYLRERYSPGEYRRRLNTPPPDDGKVRSWFEIEWINLDPRTRQILFCAYSISFLVVMALIANGISK